MNGVVAGALLRQGAGIDALSRLLTAGAAFGLLFGFGAPVVLVPMVLAGVVELYYAMRVGFDAAVFAAGDTEASLLELGLLPRAKAGRPFPQKFSGAKRLLTAQACAFVVQLALAMASPWISGASPVVHQESQRIPKALPLAGPGRSPALC